MSMLADVTEAAVALAEMQTQQENLLIAVDDVTVATSKSAGHISKTGHQAMRRTMPKEE